MVGIVVQQPHCLFKQQPKDTFLPGRSDTHVPRGKSSHTAAPPCSLPIGGSTGVCHCVFQDDPGRRNRALMQGEAALSPPDAIQ